MFVSFNEILVLMVSDDEKQQTKEVRFKGITEVQTIQFSDHDEPLYSSPSCGTSSNIYLKDVCQNKNLDICVADFDASAVVVVCQAGVF